MSAGLKNALWASVIALSTAVGAQAATVTVEFNDGITNNLGGGVKEYIEDDYRFFDARIVGGPCALPGDDKCAALNKNETTVLTRTDNAAFDLTSIWFYLNGTASKGSNSFSIFETLNPTNKVEFTQPAYLHNTGYTVALNFFGVKSLTFVSGATDLCVYDEEKDKEKCEKNEGNARFDSLVLSSETGVIPLPAAGWLLIAGLGGLGALRMRKRAA